jgi:hypothetical protein
VRVTTLMSVFHLILTPRVPRDVVDVALSRFLTRL